MEIIRFNDEWTIAKRRNEHFIEFVASILINDGVTAEIKDKCEHFEVVEINGINKIIRQIDSNIMEVIAVIDSNPKSTDDTFKPKITTINNIESDLAVAKLEIGVIDEQQVVLQRRTQNIIEILAFCSTHIPELEKKIVNSSFKTHTANIDGSLKIVEQLNDVKLRVLCDVIPVNRELQSESDFLYQLREMQKSNSILKVIDLNNQTVIVKKREAAIDVVAFINPKLSVDELAHGEVIEINGVIKFARTSGEFVEILANVERFHQQEMTQPTVDSMFLIQFNDEKLLVQGHMNRFNIIAHIHFFELSSLSDTPTVYIPVKY